MEKRTSKGIVFLIAWLVMAGLLLSVHAGSADDTRLPARLAYSADSEKTPGNTPKNAEKDQVKPAERSEDVPKLDPSLPDVPPEKPKRKNQPPQINSVVIYPDQDSIVAGYPTLTHNLMPAYATVTVNASDPDGDYPLRYDMRSSGRAKKLPNDHLNVAYIPGNKPSINDKGTTYIHIQVIDSRGAKSRIVSRAIAILDPYDDDFNEKYKRNVNKFNSNGYLRDGFLSTPRVISRSEETQGSASTAHILDSPAPWRNGLVQQCVRDYLNQVAFPVEDRLEPGRYTHIDEWGRILGPNLKAHGGVDGNWDNPTHFVWSQYDTRRATLRYGTSLRDYVADCVAGLVPRAASAAEPPLTVSVGPGLVTGEDAHDAFEALRRSNTVMFSDMEDIPTGVHTSLRVAGIAVSLQTTTIRYPLPVKSAPADTPVAVLPYSFVKAPANHRMMGVQSSHIPDGQSKFELTFSTPIGHVGLMRNWNTNSLTRFYNEAGTLLAEHRNTTNHEFVGYVADRPENRVHRIEFDGLPSQPTSRSNKLYQVGEVDDLYIETQARQEPASAAAAPPTPAPEKTLTPKPAQVASGSRGGGGISLDAVYRGLDADRVGSMNRASPDGRMDGHFTLTLDTGGEEKEVNIIMVQSARDDGQPSHLRWDTMPGGHWILGVYRDGRRLNPTDTFLKDKVRGLASYEVYGNAEDAQWFRGGSNFRVTVRFKDRQEVVAFARVRGGQQGGTQAAGEVTLTAVFRGMGPDRVGTWSRGTPNLSQSHR